MLFVGVESKVGVAHLAGRHGHFMPAGLLQSQIDTLEEPGPDEDPLTIELGPPPGELAAEIIRLLARASGPGTMRGPRG